ncbi:hypothetical protein WA026_004721 [Henosepilachna vigintioctopunctata]|uniref:Uncharacterized protein n=1 Tax=Henosepilachna vigintioctopunctata TaxID=420089 RepID=A0AAW1V7R5_9CUCU
MGDMVRIAQIFLQIDANMKEMVQKLDNIAFELQEVKQEKNKLKKKRETQKGRIVKLERTIRTKNIIIKRIIDEELGRYKVNRTRPVLVKLLKENKKIKIMKNAKQLKGTEISIDEDLQKNVQEERRALIPQLKEARNKGHKAIIKYNK